MKSKTKYETLKIQVKGPEDIFEVHRLNISKAILNAIRYGYSKRMKSVDFAEVNFAGKMTVHLAVDAREFEQLIDKNIQILEEFEEYEICADALKLKEKMLKNKVKKELVKL